ncbi:MAG TPA: alanine:cation symporter family protein [Bacteroidales bacterium]|nr:alanine:cation symporter family protein [Bacteroidales bacterium]
MLLNSTIVFSENDTLKSNTHLDNIQEKQINTREQTLSEKINNAFTPVVKLMSKILFWDPFAAAGIYDNKIYDDNGRIVLDDSGKPKTTKIPLVVIWLIIGAIFFTFYMKFINITGFKHAIHLVQGKYDDPKDKGEVSHFQALTTALSATVGLGNIAGVAIAISIGGPGATLWMIIAGLLGMSSKFVECTLGLKYRRIDKDGVVSGGPMYYLQDGLKKYKLGKLGKVLAIIFAFLVIGGSFGGGNMFQANQAFAQLSMMVPSISSYGAYFGVLMAILVAVVVIGGIKSIAKVTDKIVPFMAVFYVLVALLIIFININHFTDAMSLIWNGAFNAPAVKGGIIGVIIVGFQRAAFSNEAGVGSASIAHSAAKTMFPISEGMVALIEPFIDTVVICTMTALVIIFTGYYDPAIAQGLNGSQLTSMAFGSVFSWFPYMLMIAIFLFAFSTMISWSYYGLNGFKFLFGKSINKVFKSSKATKNIYYSFFLLFIVIGSSSNLGAVMDFSDMMILTMAFPNILGLIILSPEIKRDLKDYLNKLKSGEIKKFK